MVLKLASFASNISPGKQALGSPIFLRFTREVPKGMNQIRIQSTLKTLALRSMMESTHIGMLGIGFVYKTHFPTMAWNLKYFKRALIFMETELLIDKATFY